MLLEFQTVVTGAAGAGTRQQTAEKTELASFETAFLEAGQEDTEQPDLPHPAIQTDGVQPDDPEAIISPEDTGPSGASTHVPQDADAKDDSPPTHPMNERPRLANGRPALADATRQPSYADETGKHRPAADQPIAPAHSFAVMPEGIRLDAAIDQKMGELIAPRLSRLEHGVMAAPGSVLDANVATGGSPLVGFLYATTGTDLPRQGQNTLSHPARVEGNTTTPAGSSDREAELTGGRIRHEPTPPPFRHVAVLEDANGRLAEPATGLEVLPKPQKGRDAVPFLTEQNGRALLSVTGKADAPFPVTSGRILDQHRATSDGLAVERAKPRSDTAKPIGHGDQSASKAPSNSESLQHAKRQPCGAVDLPAASTRASSNLGSDRQIDPHLPKADRRQFDGSLHGAEKPTVLTETKSTAPADFGPRGRDGEVQSPLTEGVSVKRIGPNAETRMQTVHTTGQTRASQGGEFAKPPLRNDGVTQNYPPPKVKINAPQSILAPKMDKIADSRRWEHSGLSVLKMEPLVNGLNGSTKLESVSGVKTRNADVHPLSGVQASKSDFHITSSDKISKLDVPVALGPHAKGPFSQRSSRLEHRGTDRPLRTAEVSTKDAQRTEVRLVKRSVSPERSDLPKQMAPGQMPQEVESRASTGPVEPSLPRAEQAQKLLVPSAAPHTNMRSIARQVVQAFPAAQNGAIEIQLRPEELGHVRIQLTQLEHAMQVHVVAERGETLDLLRRHVELLQKELSTAGYSAGQFSFDRQGGQTSRPPQPQSADGPGEGTVALPERKTDARPAPVATGLDLRL